MRVVSLVPSSTESLLALGADVVACTRFCEQPGLTHVGGTKNPDVPAIVALAPDLVVLDREENRREDHDALLAAGLRVLVTDVRSIDDARRAVVEMARAVGAEVPPWPEPAVESRTRRRAFVPIWRRPWMTIGRATYGAAVLATTGITIVPDTGDDYPSVDLDEVATARPDLVVVPSEPYEFSDGHLAELARAVPEVPLVRVDGRDLFWWGVRTPEALARLTAALAPRPTP